MPRAHHGWQVKELKSKESSNAELKSKESSNAADTANVAAKRQKEPVVLRARWVVIQEEDEGGGSGVAARARYGVEPPGATPYAPRAQRGARRARVPHGVISTGLKRRRAVRATV